jgi:hypothetical protein
MKLTFSEYLRAKEQLRQAINQQPKQLLNYRSTKYCKFPVLLDGKRVDVDLRPGFLFTISWLYKNIDDTSPNPISITIDINTTEEEVLPFWKKAKLTLWLSKNAVQIF